MAIGHVCVEALRFLAGRLCLDFVNSVENRAGDQPEDIIGTLPDLIDWARHRKLFGDDDARQLLALAEQEPERAAEVLGTALALREALHRVFRAIADGDEPRASDLSIIQRAYGDAITNARLGRGDGRFRWDWPSSDDRLDSLLWPIASSAVELLTDGDPSRIKVCANPDGCGWLFYDGSKNGSRRWCSMEGCGSQVKMRRQYAKRRASGTSKEQ